VSENDYEAARRHAEEMAAMLASVQAITEAELVPPTAYAKATTAAMRSLQRLPGCK